MTDFDDSKGNTLLIIYGTETGTAQDLACQLWRRAYRQKLRSRYLPLDDYPIEEFPTESTVVFIVATSDQGEFPANMRTGWKKLLRKSLPRNFLTTVNIAVLGLGDSSYPKFNYPAKKLYRRLLQLGATPLLELGLADDQHPFGADTVCVDWINRLFEKIFVSNIFRGMLSEEVGLYPKKYRLEYSDSVENFSSSESAEILPNCYGEYRHLELLCNERLTSESHFQDTRFLTFNIENFLSFERENPFKYNPGDVLMVYPENLKGTLDLAISSLQYSDDVLDRVFKIVPNFEDISPPPTWQLKSSTSLRECLKRYFDLNAIPKRSFITLLASVSENSFERERLEELVLPESYDDYLDYCQRPRRTVAELLRDFPETAANLKPDQLFDLLPTIHPRAFSITSSFYAHPGKLQLLVARVEYKVKRMSVPRLGLCSNYLASLRPGDRILAKIRPGTFQLANTSEENPLLLIGPGTGVAPFRSIISDKARNSLSIDGRKNILLFFGCRNSLKDFYFAEEWPRYPNLTVITAFSRDQPDKIYVQHRILENRELVWDYINNRDCTILIAGSSGEMPKAVISAFKEIIEEKAGKDVDSDRYIKELEEQERIQYETWS